MHTHYCITGSSYSSSPLLVGGRGTSRQNRLYVLVFITGSPIISMILVSQVARVRTDPHSPNQYRVDGTVYNIPEFAKAFNCSAKAKVCHPRPSFHLTLRSTIRS